MNTFCVQSKRQSFASPKSKGLGFSETKSIFGAKCLLIDSDAAVV